MDISSAIAILLVAAGLLFWAFAYLPKRDNKTVLVLVVACVCFIAAEWLNGLSHGTALRVLELAGGLLPLALELALMCRPSRPARALRAVDE